MLLAMKTRNQWLVRFDPSIVAVKQSSIVSQSIPEYNTINWRDTTHFDSEDDYRTGCRNVSHCKQQQYSPIQDYVHPDDQTQPFDKVNS